MTRDVQTYRFRARWAGLAALTLCLAWPSAPARADFLINNGGFEAGFASWVRADQLGSDGTFALQTGTSSPVNGDTVPAPPGGTRAAMSDGAGPGSHVLYQDFVVPTFTITSAVLKFDLFLGNRAGTFFTPTTPSLDFSTPALNQQARVDLLNGGTDPFSVAVADVLQNLYQTKVGDAAVSGYLTTTIDLTALLNANKGKTLRLRFTEVDNVAAFQLGVDNVSLSAVPEPASLVSLGLGAGLALGARRWRRHRGAC